MGLFPSPIFEVTYTLFLLSRQTLSLLRRIRFQSNPRSGSPTRYGWIWDRFGRAQRLASSSASTTPVPNTSNEEDSYFVRRGGSPKNCAHMRDLRARNRQQQIQIVEIRDALDTYVITNEVTRSVNIKLEDQIGEMGVAYATMYTNFLGTMEGLIDALETIRVQGISFS